MSEYVSPAVVLSKTFDSVLSENVRPFLRARGFAKSGRTFRRTRGPLYDMINFQGSKWNGVAPHHGFFVNIGVGSSEMDAVHLDRQDGRAAGHGYVLDTRWERLVPGAPAEVKVDQTTNRDHLAETICGNLELALATIDSITSSAGLAQWAIANNWLHHMEKTCSYLASVDDVESLTRYISSLRSRFHGDARWSTFNRRLVSATGLLAQNLQAQGLLDADSVGEGPDERRTR